MSPEFDRRGFLKAVGAAGVGVALSDTAAAGPDVSTRVLDRQFDLEGGLQEALVVFDEAASAERLDALDLAEPYHVFENLGIGWASLSPGQLETVAGWEEVRRVKRAEELEWHNDEVSRESMRVDAVREELGYAGEDTHVVVIDSGLNASHPGVDADRVEANYHYVDEPTGPRDPVWVDAGPGDTDTVGHGQHCAGIVAGTGEGGLEGRYEGMAPKTTITSYGVVQYLYLPYVVAAWDHLLGRVRTEPEFDPDVVTNSYGVSRGVEYNPNDPVNVATWQAYREGILPVFSFGNDGEDGYGTGNRFAKAPHVLGVGATEKTIDTADTRENRPVTAFSSRGRPYDPEAAADEPTRYVDDRVFHDRERVLENLETFHAIQDGARRPVDSGTFTGTVGPGVNTYPFLVGEEEYDTGSAYEHLQTHANVDLVDLTLSLDPEGQWVRLTVYDDDGETVAQMREEVFKQHDTLTVDVEGGTTYTLELEPEDAVVADYTVEYEQFEAVDGDPTDARPVTLFRPGVGAHGAAVMSTQDKHDVLGPLGETGDAEPFYGRLSGTSMSGPAVAGIALLVVQAYREEGGGEDPDPADVIRIIEHAAATHNPDYTVATVGSGFVDAAAAVSTAERIARGASSIEDLDTGLDALVDPSAAAEPTLDLEATGRRESDRDATTGRQAHRIVVTLESVDEVAASVAVYDEIPAEWNLLERHGDAREVETEDGRTHVRLVRDGDETVEADDLADGDEVEFTYFVESPDDPDETDRYTFGPAAAVVETWAVDEEARGDDRAEFGDTDDVLATGVET